MSDEDFFALVDDNEDWREYEKKTTPVHTAARLKKNDPLRYEQCRRLLECGVELLVIAECMKVGVNTLYAIIDNELGGQDAWQKGMEGRMTRVFNLGVSRISQLLLTTKSLAEASMATGVIFDKLQMLKGAPGVIVEQRITVHSEKLESLNALAQEVKERLAKARVIEEAPLELTEGGQTILPLPAGQGQGLKHEA